MFKKISIIAMIILLTISLAYAGSLFRGSRAGQWTTEATADGAAYTGAGAYLGITVITDGTNNCTFTIYDNTAASGTVLPPGSAFVVLGTSYTFAFSTGDPVLVTNGIYVDVTAAGGGTCKYKVNYDN